MSEETKYQCEEKQIMNGNKFNCDSDIGENSSIIIDGRKRLKRGSILIVDRIFELPPQARLWKNWDWTNQADKKELMNEFVIVDIETRSLIINSYYVDGITSFCKHLRKSSKQYK